MKAYIDSRLVSGQSYAVTEQQLARLLDAALGVAIPRTRWQKIRHLLRYRKWPRAYTHTFSLVDPVAPIGGGFIPTPTKRIMGIDAPELGEPIG